MSQSFELSLEVEWNVKKQKLEVGKEWWKELQKLYGCLIN